MNKLPQSPKQRNRDLFIARGILCHVREYDRSHEILERAGITMDQHFITDGLFHMALDIIGVPFDTCDPESGEGFCRDWFSDEWDEVKRDPDEFIKRCLQAISAPSN